ncbi:MAG: hypothetical protein COX57_13560 [Alphaproteobacteria bacterium CG_4_10_14_0_2_um_filter_63_37]|nr:MAG: hypothetical protein AUJ55_12865 [Proteobacteria bacterium CG1_02_64_396]PJA23507.1 MAG: hypothetical protein COX57_13560 [Alphaproteobacteria bacterium CG_4_10_14_0_2_um_filter_63_37]
MKMALRWGAMALGLAWSQPVIALSLHPLDESDWALIERAETLLGSAPPHFERGGDIEQGIALSQNLALDPFTRGLLEQRAPDWSLGLHGAVEAGVVYSKGRGMTMVDPPVDEVSPLSDQRWGMWDPSGGSGRGAMALRWDGPSWALRAAGEAQSGGGTNHGQVTDLEGRLLLGNQVVAAGRGKSYWGYGGHGAMVLSDSHRPFDRIAIGNQNPYQAWGLGPLRYEVGLARLEANRTIPRPWWLGIHVEAQPTERLEFALFRAIMMGGDGRPSPWPLDRFLRILSGVNIGQPNASGVGDPGTDTSNSIAGFAMSYRVGGVKFYLEAGGEDEAKLMPSRPAVLVGFYRPGLAPEGRGDFRLEWMRTDSDGSNNWYRHHIYTTGYTFQSRLLGHHVGTNGSDLFLSYRVWGEQGGWVELSVDAERRMGSLPTAERRTQTGIAGLWRLNPALALQWMGGMERIDNRGGQIRPNVTPVQDARGSERLYRAAVSALVQF